MYGGMLYFPLKVNCKGGYIISILAKDRKKT